jgi:hypothetical protein
VLLLDEEELLELELELLELELLELELLELLPVPFDPLVPAAPAAPAAPPFPVAPAVPAAPAVPFFKEPGFFAPTWETGDLPAALASPPLRFDADALLSAGLLFTGLRLLVSLLCVAFMGEENALFIDAPFGEAKLAGRLGLATPACDPPLNPCASALADRAETAKPVKTTVQDLLEVNMLHLDCFLPCFSFVSRVEQFDSSHAF